MEDQTRETLVRQVLAETANLPIDVKTLSVTANLYDAGLSSLSTVNVMIEMEEKFDIEIPDSKLERNTFQSIASLINVVKELQAKQSATI